MSLKPRLPLALVVSISVSIGCVWLLAIAQAQSPALDVKLSSEPPFEHIGPDDDLATVTVTALLNGKPLSRGHLALRLTAPPRFTVLTTDFPWVEGTPLLALDSDVQADGTFTMQYVFPIRGLYTFDVELTPTPGGPAFPPTRVHKTVRLYENPAEVRNAWLLVLGLFVLGGIVGLVLARSAAARDALSQRAGVLSCLVCALVLCGSRPLLAAGTDHAGSHATAHHESHGPQVVQGADGWSLEVQPQPASATVGQLLDLNIRLKKDDKVVQEGTEVLLTLTSQEDEKEIMKTALHLRTGEGTQRVQFFDGAPHTVTVSARPLAISDMAPLTVKLGMDVEALHPPMVVKLRVFGLLIGVLVLGMIAGFFFPRRDRELSGV